MSAVQWRISASAAVLPSLSVYSGVLEVFGPGGKGGRARSERARALPPARPQQMPPMEVTAEDNAGALGGGRGREGGGQREERKKERKNDRRA